jgi:hypothetical protein
VVERRVRGMGVVERRVRGMGVVERRVRGMGVVERRVRGVEARAGHLLLENRALFDLLQRKSAEKFFAHVRSRLSRGGQRCCCAIIVGSFSDVHDFGSLCRWF